MKTEAFRLKKVYAFFDVEMKMWTEPQVLRNDVEAKKLFNHFLKTNQFNGCPVEMYCLGDFILDSDSSISPLAVNTPRKIYFEDTVDDGDVVNE